MKYDYFDYPIGQDDPTGAGITEEMMKDGWKVYITIKNKEDGVLKRIQFRRLDND